MSQVATELTWGCHEQRSRVERYSYQPTAAQCTPSAVCLSVCRVQRSTHGAQRAVQQPMEDGGTAHGWGWQEGQAGRPQMMGCWTAGALRRYTANPSAGHPQTARRGCSDEPSKNTLLLGVLWRIGMMVPRSCLDVKILTSAL